MADTNVFTSLGIDAGKLIWQIVNFGILFFVLKKLLYKPILNKLDERAKLIKTGALAAEKSIKDEESAQAKREELLAKTRKEVEQIIEKAKKDALDIKEDIIKEAKVEATKILDKKQAEITDMISAQKQELQSEISNLSVSIARTVLKEYLDSKTQDSILETQLQKIAKMKI